MLKFASLQFFDEPTGMALSGGAHVAARFMLASEPLHGLRSTEELTYVMAGYDGGTEWPRGSGLSFTQGVAPDAWDQGFRMAHHAVCLMQAMVDELPGRYQGPMEFPMKTVAQSCRNALLRIAGGADWRDVTSPGSWRRIVAGCGHRSLMSLVSAAAPRLRQRAGTSS